MATPEQLEAALKTAEETIAQQKKLIDEDKSIMKSKKDRLSILLQRTPTCSGSCRVELRQFIEIIDTARRYSEASDAEVIPQVMSLVTDPLRSAIDSHVRDKVKIEWPDIKEFIVKQFLDSDEADFLQKLIDATKQTFTEDVRSYCLRFSERVRRAYTAQELDQKYLQKDLIRKFIGGIESQSIRQELWKEDPTDLTTTVNKACTLAKAFEMAAPSLATGVGSYATSNEERMDISAATTGTKSELEKMAENLRLSDSPKREERMKTPPHPRPRPRSQSAERGATRHELR